MKLNKKGFFKGVKALLLIIMLSFTFLFSLGIRGNKPRLMANERFEDAYIVPNTGYIENVYINKYRTTAQTIDFLNNVNLNYVINPMAEQTSIVRNDMYVILCSQDLTKVLVIFRYSVLDEGVFIPQIYQVSFVNYTTMAAQLLFVSREVSYEGVDTYSGWQISTPEINIDSTLVSSVPNFNFPVGQQNDLLGQFVAISSRFVDMYSYNYGYNSGLEHGLTEGERNGYTYGYNDGYDDGLSAGLEEGYDEGYIYGYDDGYDEGYDIGYVDASNEGYDAGYQNGYNDGRLEQSPIGLEWFKSAISVVNSFLEIQILPNVSIGAILSGFVILVLLKWILAWFRG